MIVRDTPQKRTLAPREDPGNWDAYIMQHPKGTVFHTSWMMRAYGETPQCEPFAIAARNDRGEIIALLTAVRVAVFSGMVSCLTSRSILYAEPLCDPTLEGQEALRTLICEHDRSMQGKTLYSEVRPIDAPGEEREVLTNVGYDFREYLNYVLDVSHDVETLWNNLRKSTRQSILRSQRRGVKVMQDSTHSSIDRMYALIKKSYQRSRVPLVNVQLFHAALDYFPKHVVQVRIATYEGRDVAAGIGLMFRGRFYAWYGGSLRVPQIAPFDCLTWDEIRWTNEKGGRYYDFGGAGWPSEEYGPRAFKEKFRGELVCHGRYRRVYSPRWLMLAEASYRLFRRLMFRLWTVPMHELFVDIGMSAEVVGI